MSGYRRLLDYWPGRSDVSRLTDAVIALQQEIIIMAENLQTLIDQLRQDVAAQADVQKSAETLIAGIPQLIQDAISKAQSAGATDEQLQALHDLDQQIQSQSKALSDAVTANTDGNQGQNVQNAPGAPQPQPGATNPSGTTDQTGEPTGPGSQPPSAG
jgi:hypothetical protein